jgi:hypothetical protein
MAQWFDAYRGHAAKAPFPKEGYVGYVGNYGTKTPPASAGGADAYQAVRAD